MQITSRQEIAPNNDPVNKCIGTCCKYIGPKQIMPIPTVSTQIYKIIDNNDNSDRLSYTGYTSHP